jgi:protein SCO1/2
MSSYFSAITSGRRDAGSRRAVVLPGVLAVALLVAGCGGGGTATDSASRAVKFAGLPASPSKPAPPLVLRDSLGHRVDLEQFGGKAVLVTFIYDHCPDTCPLIVANLRVAQTELGPRARDLQVVAVSVDPVGDTPRTVNAFLRAHGMRGRMEYLIGSRPQLERVWRNWDVVSRSPNRGNPAQVEHSALIYGIDASGRITTLYPSNFRPRQIVHDVPILASR